MFSPIALSSSYIVSRILDPSSLEICRKRDAATAENGVRCCVVLVFGLVLVLGSEAKISLVAMIYDGLELWIYRSVIDERI
ncbi:hypothetical protein QVD17_21897 [Tagetes erecta]|uniref:Uncharacterized protein n=1 Tax=Tagetes erecta TaxID=13708 RepID=A0AAD8KCG2_TARER|nr:hypothetical protein QVD17_21897 [Tagetes erecta]